MYKWNLTFKTKITKRTYAPEKMLGYILVHSIISLRLSNLSLHLHERRQQYTAWIEFSLFVPEDECQWQFCKAIGTVFLKLWTNDSLCAWEKIIIPALRHCVSSDVTERLCKSTEEPSIIACFSAAPSWWNQVSAGENCNANLHKWDFKSMHCLKNVMWKLSSNNK